MIYSFYFSSNDVQVDGKIVTADHVLIATGGQPSVLNFKGNELAISSDGFFELTDQPENVVYIFREL